MHTTTRRLTVALAAAALLIAAGCAKDESVTTSETTAPVTASSSDEKGTTSTTEDDEDETTTTTEPDDDDDTTTTTAKKGGGKTGTPTGNYEEACAKIEEIDSMDDDAPDDEAFAAMEEARDAGPEELRDHWDTLIGVFEDLMAIDENDPDALERAFEVMGDEQFLAAAAAIDDFAEEECGLDLDLDPAEEDSTIGGLSTER